MATSFAHADLTMAEMRSWTWGSIPGGDLSLRITDDRGPLLAAPSFHSASATPGLQMSNPRSLICYSDPGEPSGKI
jgi:hypothetical protein